MNADPRVMRWFPSTARPRGVRRRRPPGSTRSTPSTATPPGRSRCCESERGPGAVRRLRRAGAAHVRPAVRPRRCPASRSAGGSPRTGGASGSRPRAARAALRFGLPRGWGCAEVVSFTVPPNLPSQAVMQRIGMRYDGVFDHPARRAPATGGDRTSLYRATADDLRATDGPRPVELTRDRSPGRRAARARGGKVRRAKVKPPPGPAAVDPIARVAVDVPLPAPRPAVRLRRPRADVGHRRVPGARVRVRFAGTLVDGWVLERTGHTRRTPAGWSGSRRW